MTAESPEKDEELPYSWSSPLSVPPVPLQKSIPSSHFRQRIKLYKNSLKSSALAHVNLNFSSQLAVMAQLSAHRSMVARAKAKVDCSPPASLFTPLGRKNEQTKLRIKQMSGANSLHLSRCSTPRSQSARGFSPAQSHQSLLEKMDQFLSTQPPVATVSLSDKIQHFLDSIQDNPTETREEMDKGQTEPEKTWLGPPSSSTSLTLSSEPLPPMAILNNYQPPHSEDWTPSEPSSHSKISAQKNSREVGDELKVRFKTDLTQQILKYQAFTDRSLLQVCQIFRKRYLNQMSSEAMDGVIAELMADLQITPPVDAQCHPL